MNMSYCRFQNTLGDLRDCQENILADDLGRDERRYRRKLVEICREIALVSDEELERLDKDQIAMELADEENADGQK